MKKNYYILSLRLLQMLSFGRVIAAAESLMLDKIAITQEAEAIIQYTAQQEPRAHGMWEEARAAWAAMDIRDYHHDAVPLINDLYTSTRCIHNNNKDAEIFFKELQNALDQNDIETVQEYLSQLRQLRKTTAEQLEPTEKGQESAPVKLERLKAWAEHMQQERIRQQIKSDLKVKKNAAREKSGHLVNLALQQRPEQLFSYHPAKGPREKLQHGELPSISPGNKILFGLANALNVKR
jgi:hypothetical protein